LHSLSPTKIYTQCNTSPRANLYLTGFCHRTRFEVDQSHQLRPEGGSDMTTTLPVIDADAHVIETERTWEYLEPSEQKYRPQLFYSKDDGNQQYWVIDGKIRGFRFPTL